MVAVFTTANAALCRCRAAHWIVSIAALCYAGPTSAFYLPGVAPIEYRDGGQVDLKVNSLTSAKTQLPYAYYVLPYCRPPKINDSIENLGEILMGDTIENSPYEIYMSVNTSCQVLCKGRLDDSDKDKFRAMIDDEYLVNWIVDNLPAATKFITRKPDSREEVLTFLNGFPVGVKTNNRYYINNHVRLHLKFHSNAKEYEGHRIVGFEVQPYSLNQATRKDSTGKLVGVCYGERTNEPFDLELHDEVVFTYDVMWTYSDHRWASRWDNYLKMTGGQVHWFSILNSLMIVLFLSAMVAMILLRTLHRDIAQYNEIATVEEAQEETGWKLVHGDVFREPVQSKLLFACVGSGAQILAMCGVTLAFAVLGFLSPAHRGALLQSMMLLFTLMGCLGGYVAARFYKLFQKDDWKVATLVTATMYPGICFLIFFVLNLCIWGEKSAGAVPFTTLLAILVLWFGISVPLVFLGAYIGYRRPTIELPVHTNAIPRSIPEQPWFVQSTFTCLVGGILPFGSVFTELFFIMSSIWQHQFYYLFGFLALVLIILVVTCAEMSIALTYFQLTTEDYRWWWRSFFASGSSAVYVFLYACLYFNTRLHIVKFISMLLYFGYMLLVSFSFFLLSGTIGLISSFIFARAIYGSIKVD